MKILNWAREHKRTVLVGLLIIVALGAGLVGRCRPPDKTTTKVEQTKETDKQKIADVKKDIQKRIKKVREEYRPDGTLAARTTTNDGSTETTAAKIVTVVKEVETIKTITVVERKKVSPLAVAGSAEWDRLQVRPSDYRLGADVPVGEVMGLRLRAGPIVHWRVGDPVPASYGVSVRIELP